MSKNIYLHRPFRTSELNDNDNQGKQNVERIF